MGSERRRRLRIRRKRKTVANDAGEQVVVEAGCCLVELVAAASVTITLFVIPDYFLAG